MMKRPMHFPILTMSKHRPQVEDELALFLKDILIDFIFSLTEICRFRLLSAWTLLQRYL